MYNFVAEKKKKLRLRTEMAVRGCFKLKKQGNDNESSFLHRKHNIETDIT